MWSIGRCKTSIAGQVGRHIYLASKLTANVITRFSKTETALLFVAERFQRLEDNIAHRIVPIEDALCIDQGHIILNMARLADELHAEKANRDKPKGEALVLCRIERLKKIVHLFLMKAGKAYFEHGKGSTSDHPTKTLKRPSVKLVWIEYRRAHKDDPISEDTVQNHLTARKEGKMANDPSCLLRELWKRANNEREIADYYEAYTGFKIKGDSRGFELDDSQNEYNPDYDEGYSEEQINEFIAREGVSVVNSP